MDVKLTIQLLENLKNIIFDNPTTYIFVQRMFGAHRLRKKCIDILTPLPNERILDIGCGPAYSLDYMPKLEYVGFDTNESQIQYARKKYKGKCEFYSEPFSEAHSKRQQPFDAILLLGLLHHLSDAESHSLLDLLSNVLKPEGRIVTLDPCFTDNQSAISRFVAENDRGKHVRSKEGYINLLGNRFSNVNANVHHNIGRLPSTELIMLIKP